jgi:hypothetical protein
VKFGLSSYSDLGVFLTFACHELRVFYARWAGCQVFTASAQEIASISVPMDEDSYGGVAEIF